MVRRIGTNGVTRRGALAMLSGAAAANLVPALSSPASAAASGLLPYGAAVRIAALQDDAAYRQAIISHCDMIVPEGGMKWADLRPAQARYEFTQADQLAAFARDRGLELRGHTLAWYGAMPDWTAGITTAREAERELTSHIETVMSRYRGVVRSWDVVNEPVPDKPGAPTDLRDFVWSRCLGADYIPIAFRAAAAVDPEATLVLNEYDVEFIGGRFRARRDALRHIVRSLLDRDVPIHAVGLQAHLFGDRDIDRDGLQAFIAELKSWGLKIIVTELDVVDNLLPADPEQRDAAVAAKAEDFLEAVFAAARPEAILTWGLTDRYTWVPIWFKRRDGRPNRPLPYDDAMRPKPLMAVIERFRGRGA